MPVQTEKESRAKLFYWARENGCEEQLKKILKRYDELMKHCKTQEERHALAIMGNLELYNWYGGGGPLVINGVVIKE